MPLPSVLSRRNPYLNKKDFGHVLIVAGSAGMLGACALSALAAMRSGAGMVTAAVAKSLNLTLQKKISNVVMTCGLPETARGTISDKAFVFLKKTFLKFNAVAIGPGLGLDKLTQRMVYQMVEHYPGPMVVDADALNALSSNLKPLLKAKGPRILTPHEGEMSRLIGKKSITPSIRQKVAVDFAKKYQCVVVLKGKNTIVASAKGDIFINTTGNVGLATAGSGDVLTGMMAAFLAQQIDVYQAACLAVNYHGRAADQAIKKYEKASLIAEDLITYIPKVLLKS